MAGATFSHTFEAPGTFPYICMVHPWMEGIVVVTGSGGDTEPEDPPEPTPSPTPIPNGVDVVVPQGTSVPGCEETKSCYDPYTIRVKEFSTVTWYNADSAAHTVTSGTAADGPTGVFDSSLFMAGTTFSHTFESAGEFPYHCMVHPWMTGYVIVERDAYIPPDPEPVPQCGPNERLVRDRCVPIDVTPPKILQPTDIEVDSDNPDGVRVSYDVLVIDDTDEIVQPTCTPRSGSFFSVGDKTVTCTARDSAGNYATQITFTVTVNPPGLSIPSWVKNVAEFWCEDKIDDGAFVEGIQYLIDNDIIVVPATSVSEYGSQEVPQWVKNNACWWAAGLITDEDFAAGIEYLVREGIIRV